MSAGDLSSRLRDRIDIVRPTETATGKGGYTTTLVPIATDVAAEVLSLTGGEAVKEKVLQGIHVFRITIRYRDGILQSDQVSLSGETLNIRSAIDPDRRRREIVILADTEATRAAS